MDTPAAIQGGYEKKTAPMVDNAPQGQTGPAAPEEAIEAVAHDHRGDAKKASFDVGLAQSSPHQTDRPKQDQQKGEPPSPRALKGNLVELPSRTEALHSLLDNYVGLAVLMLN